MFGKSDCGFGSMGKMGHGKCGPMGILSDLDLSDEQLLGIAELKGKTFGKMARNMLEFKEMKKEVFKELFQPKADQAKVHDLTAQIKEHASQCIDLLSENMIASSELLTPEQKAKLRLALVRKFLGVEEILTDEEV